MSTTPAVYLICDTNCKYEGMTKEQILTAIVQAVNEGTIGDINTGFITTVKTITGTPLKFFVGTQAEYDALTDEDKQNLFAVISNDTIRENILETLNTALTNIADLQNNIQEHEKHKFPLVCSYTQEVGSNSFVVDLTNFVDGTAYLVEYVATYDKYFYRVSTGSFIYRVYEGYDNCWDLNLGQFLITFNNGTVDVPDRSTAYVWHTMNGEKTEATYQATLNFYKIGTI